MLGAGPPGPWQTLSKSSIRFGPSCPRLPAQWRPMPARKNTTTKADGGQLVGYAPCLHPPAGPRAATRRACSRPLAVVVSIASRSEWKATCRCSSAAITSDQRPPREVHRRKEGRRAGDARPWRHEHGAARSASDHHALRPPRPPAPRRHPPRTGRRRARRQPCHERQTSGQESSRGARRRNKSAG